MAVKKPQDHLSPATDDFVFASSAGAVTLPKFGAIRFGVIRKMRKEDPSEQMFMLVEEVSSAETLEVIDALPQKEIEVLFTKWQEDSGVDQGESSAS
jgi:hypothetical protein